MDETNEKHTEHEARLSEADAKAVDAFFGDSSGDHDAGRSQAVNALMALLGTPIADESGRTTRIDVTQIRLGQTDPTLDSASRSSVDDWFEHETPLTERDEKHAQLVGTITEGAPINEQSRQTLIERTLEAIQSDIDQQDKRFILDLPVVPSGKVRVADLVSVAAMLLLLASVVIPVMGTLRSGQLQAECEGNLAGLASAFGMYAGSNQDSLPLATAGFGGTWMDVGTTPERSNSSNLFMLVRTKHASLADLACPTNPNALTEAPVDSMHDWHSHDEISYSYRIMTPGGLKAHEIEQPDRMIVLSDRSPVILRIVKGVPVIPEENTPNHDRMGQHMLGLDGSSRWTTSPVVEQGDNIWFPRPIEEAIYQARDRLGILQGNEMPSGPTDAFVGP